ncbi:MAG: hypothetical protein ABIO70_15185 [Pseudomonadota bacterium]
MDCPRCGAPNLPGLPLCVDCGQDLNAAPEVPESLVPRAAVANPLAERRPKPERPPLRRRVAAFAHVGRLRHLPLEAFGAALVGMARGCIPGLMPALRRDRRGAAIQLGAFLLPLAVLLLLGGRQALGQYSFLVAFGWCLSPVSEARRAMDTPEPYRSSAACLLGIGPALFFGLALRFLVQPIPPMAFQFNMEGSLLPASAFHVVPLHREPLRRGMLVAFDRADVADRLAWLQAHAEDGGHGALTTYEHHLGSYRFFASPVVALPGDLLDADGDAVRVDSSVSDAVPITSWARAPLASELHGQPVPAGMVAVWDWVPYPADHTLHLLLVPEERVLGVLTGYRDQDLNWTPLHWPADARGHRDPQEQP